MPITHASLPVAKLSAAQAVAASIDFAELKLSQHGLFWNQFTPADGQCRIWHFDGQHTRCLTPTGFSVRSRVYEYGGGNFCVGDKALWFVNERDQQIYTQALNGSAPHPITCDQSCRYGDLHWHNGTVFAVQERHARGVHHCLVAIDSQGTQVLAEGADFYAAPTLNAQDTRLAWIEWNRPHQPWTQTRLMCRTRNSQGLWGAPQCIAEAQESLQQPRFDAQGQLYCLSDRHGFWQPWGEINGQWQALPAHPADHAAAPWQLGTSTWQAISAQAYLATWFENGFSQLALRHDSGHIQHFSSTYSRFRSLCMDATHIYAIAASPTRAPCVISIDRHTASIRVLAGGQALLADDEISSPQPFCYPSGNSHAHGFFYAPHHVSTPPLLVFIHSGPTSACYPVLEPRIQYWTQRGFAVADLNYRGSTGYGRAYRQALHQQWGQYDVEDACAAVDYLAQQSLIDRQKAFIRGSSAGGYTTLCALAFSNVFRAGASLYGVSDPLALARVTHKFESDYLSWLIGDPEKHRERYQQRTPLQQAQRIRVPVIFFQGERDPVVVPEQTHTMLNALKANGINAQGHFYPQERHGFRNAQNLAHALDAEWKFYCNVLAQGGEPE